jgi:hypothetical protein
MSVATLTSGRGVAVIWGLLGAQPFGGMVWQVVHYLVALRRLGFDVWYVEESRMRGLNPLTQEVATGYGLTAQYLDRWLSHFGFGDRWVLVEPEWMGGSYYGALDSAGLDALYRECVFAANLCGAHKLTERHAPIRCRVYLETDPVSLQVALANGKSGLRDHISQYHAHFTYGANIGSSDCLVPESGFDWRPTRPPVCIDLWEGGAPGTMVSTVANLSHDHNHTEWNGEKWRWSKSSEFAKFETLPEAAQLPLEIALGGNSGPEDIERLKRNGWSIINARRLDDPFDYRDYIQGSRAEFSVAKEQYVRPRSGWFSDRSVCYLAAGRPVLLQDTGFSKYLPTGEGLFAVSDRASAIEALHAIAEEPDVQARRAREIAGDCFEAGKVVGAMVDEIGL